LPAAGQLDRDLDVLLDAVTFTVDDLWARTTAARRATGRPIGRPVSSPEWLRRLRRSGV
jgi:hypothetical protein